jgi:hypothetical protein
MSGVVQSEQTTCHSHGTSLFPWWPQFLLGSRTAGSDIKCWWELFIRVGGMSVRLWCKANDRVGRLGIQIEIRAFCKKIGYTTAGWIGHYRCWDVAQYYDMYDAFIWMGYVGIHTQIKCRSWNLTARMTHTISLPQYKMHCSLKQEQHVSQWYTTCISIWYLSNCIAQCHWTGGKVGCQIGKAHCSGEAKQKV